jgi:YVTN family beta-propeller protein
VKYFSFIIAGFFLLSCVKDKPPVNQPVTVQLSSSGKVYIVNEGKFMSGDAAVSLYDPGTGQVVENYYQSQNNAALGDIAESMNYFNSGYYIVVNNSNKIMICDGQLKFKAAISGLSSPRYILPVSNSKAYVSDLYSNSISIVSLNTNSVTGAIPCPGWTERMVMLYNKVYVTNMYRNYAYVINAANDSKIDSINVGPNAGSIVVDKNDNIWVLSAGDQSKNINGTLNRYNTALGQVDKVLVFSNGDSPFSLCLNKTKDTLYYLNNGVFRISINDNFLPGSAFIAKNGRTFYGLGINPSDYNIYVSDAIDYISKSSIYIYSPSGAEKSSFKAGINANSFYFE